MCMATLNRNPKLLVHSIKRSRRISTPASRIASWMVCNIGVVHSVQSMAQQWRIQMKHQGTIDR